MDIGAEVYYWGVRVSDSSKKKISLDAALFFLRIESHGMLESTTPPTMFAGGYSMLSAIFNFDHFFGY